MSVLVIETGPFDQNEDFVLIPGAWTISKYVSFIFSTPQPQLNNGVFPVLAGRVVGGGSAVNAMFFYRGAAEDYDGWESLGAKGWGWKDLLPYFKKVRPCQTAFQA